MPYIKADVARLIQSPTKDSVYVFSLSSHTKNVRILAENWNDKHIQIGNREKLVYAALHHDDKKPDFFKVNIKYDNVRFSFRGHAKNFSYNDKYIEKLVQLHHAFSVGEIVLSVDEFDDPVEKKTFPDDLFILQFCDKLDSALIGKAFTFSSKSLSIIGSSIFFKPRNEMTVKLSPYPFRHKAISLRHHYKVIQFNTAEDLIRKISDKDFDKEFLVVLQSEI